MPRVILRTLEIVRRRGVSKTTHYTDIQRGLWTRPLALGERASGDTEEATDAQIAARVRGDTEAQIRALVRELEAARATAGTEAA